MSSQTLNVLSSEMDTRTFASHGKNNDAVKGPRWPFNTEKTSSFYMGEMWVKTVIPMQCSMPTKNANYRLKYEYMVPD